MEQNESQNKTTEHLWTKNEWIDNWQFSVIYLILFSIVLFILFVFAQLSFNNQLMQSVRDHLIDFKLRAKKKNNKEKETETGREWWREKKRNRSA